VPQISIRDKVRTIIGETYDVLTVRASQPYDRGARPDVVGDAIRETLERLFTAGTTEADITSEFVAGYTAMVATRRVIPAAINYHMEKTGLSDTIGTGLGGASGNPNLTPETRQHYDRVAELRNLDGMLREAIQQGQDDFQELATALLRRRTAVADSGPALSTVATGMKTEDPDDMPPVDPWRHPIFVGALDAWPWP
jgi:hypothetical protein